MSSLRFKYVTLFGTILFLASANVYAQGAQTDATADGQPPFKYTCEGLHVAYDISHMKDSLILRIRIVHPEWKAFEVFEGSIGWRYDTYFDDDGDGEPDDKLDTSSGQTATSDAYFVSPMHSERHQADGEFSAQTEIKLPDDFHTLSLHAVVRLVGDPVHYPVYVFYAGDYLVREKGKQLLIQERPVPMLPTPPYQTCQRRSKRPW